MCGIVARKGKASLVSLSDLVSEIIQDSERGRFAPPPSPNSARVELLLSHTLSYELSCFLLLFFNFTVQLYCTVSDYINEYVVYII